MGIPRWGGFNRREQARVLVHKNTKDDDYPLGRSYLYAFMYMQIQSLDLSDSPMKRLKVSLSIYWENRIFKTISFRCATF